MVVPDGLAALVRAAQEESRVNEVDATPSFMKEEVEKTDKETVSENVATAPQEQTENVSVAENTAPQVAAPVAEPAPIKETVMQKPEPQTAMPQDTVAPKEEKEESTQEAIAFEAVKDIPDTSMTFEKKNDSWLMFEGFLLKYKKDTSKGKEIWINEDIRYELDKIKTASRSSMKLKTMVNAMLETFLVMHKEEIQEILSRG